MENDEYSLERIRMALCEDDHWDVHGISAGNFVAEAESRADHAVALVRAEDLTVVAPRPFPVPVLGIVPSGLFDAVPEGLCDDLIQENWTASELRYRLSRLDTREHRFIGSRTFVCRPGEISAGDRRVGISPAQYRFLVLLIRARTGLVSREALSAVLLDSEAASDAGRTVDMHISRLRRKLRQLTAEWQAPPRIVSHRGQGYSLS